MCELLGTQPHSDASPRYVTPWAVFSAGQQAGFDRTSASAEHRPMHGEPRMREAGPTAPDQNRPAGWAPELSAFLFFEIVEMFAFFFLLCDTPHSLECPVSVHGCMTLVLPIFVF